MRSSKKVVVAFLAVSLLTGVSVFYFNGLVVLTVDPNEYLAQGTNNRTPAEIKHELDCRLRLLQQNREI